MENFDDSWGALHSHEAPIHLSKESQFSLEQLQSTKHEKLTGWLADLIDGTPGAKESHMDTWLPKRYALIEQSAFSWIDELFAELNLFTREFNSSSAGQQTPIVAAGPKTTLTLPCRRDPSFAPYKFTCYQGHLASHNSALLIRSYYETIQIFLIPSEMLFALESDLLANEVKPLIELIAVVNEEEVHWTSTGAHLASETIPAIARELFSDFLRLTLNVITVSDLLHSNQNTQVTKTVHGNAQEEASQLVKDLHLWQAGSIFYEALSHDQEVLAKRSTEVNDKFSLGAIAKLKSQYDDLIVRLVDLSSALKSTATSKISAS